MEVLFLLIPLSVVLVFLIGLAFWWSVRNGQYDDLEGPGYRILMDDDAARDALRADNETGRGEVEKKGLDAGEVPRVD